MKFKTIILLITLLAVIVAVNVTVAAGEGRQVTITNITMSANTDPSHPGTLLNDGDPDSYWDVKPDSGDGWVELSLNQAALIYGLQLNGNLSADARLGVEYQQNGYWMPFLGGSIRAIPAQGIIDLSYDRVVSDKLRLRLIGSGVSGGRLAEIKVLGQAATSVFHLIEPVEIKYSKDSSRTAPSKFLVDRNTYTSWKTCQDDGDDDSDELGDNPIFEADAFHHHRVGQTRTEDSRQVELELGGSYRLNNINLFITSDSQGSITVKTKSGHKWQTVGQITLAGQAGWERMDLSQKQIDSDRILIQFEERQNHGRGRSDHSKRSGGIGEVEIWGYGAYSGARHQTLVSVPQPVNQALNYSFTIEEDGITDNRLELAVAGEYAHPVTVELNGIPVKLQPTLKINGNTVYQYSIPETDLWEGENFIRVLPGNQALTLLQLQVSEGLIDAEVPFTIGGLNDGLRLTPAEGNGSDFSLVRERFIEAVEIYAPSNLAATVSAKTGTGLTQLTQTETGDGYLYFQGGVSATGLNIINHTGLPFAEIRVLASADTDAAPEIKIIWPMPVDRPGKEIPECDDDDKEYVLGRVDNPEAQVFVNGKSARQSGHYFWIRFSELGFNYGEINMVTVKAIDPAGRESSKQMEFFWGDTPEYRIDQKDIIYYTSKTAFTLSGQVGSRQYQLFIDEKPVSMDQKRRFTAVVTLEEGFNLIPITFHYTDKGREMQYTVYRRVVSESSAPKLYIDTPISGTYFNTATLTITGTVSGNNPTVRVNGLRTPVENGWFRSLPVPLIEGKNTIKVEATDGYGRKTTQEVIVYKDTKAPLISEITPSNGFLSNTSQITVSGKVFDTSQAYVYVNGKFAPCLNGRFTTTLTLVEGENQIKVTAIDLAGNSKDYIFRVTVDTIAPLEFRPTADPSGWTNNNRPAISFATTDATSGVGHYEIRAGSGAWVTLVVSPYRFATAIPDGEQTVQVKAVDKAGNETIGEVKVYIDTVPPAAPNGFEVIPGIDRVVLKWREVDLSGETVGYRIKRTPAFSSEAFKEIFRPAEMEDLNQFIDAAVNSGVSYAYTVQAIDHAGNVGAATTTLTAQIGSVSQAVNTGGGTVKFDSVTITFPQGALATSGQVVIEEAGSLPENIYATKLGSAYSFTLLDEQGKKVRAEFDEPVKLEISYADFNLPSGFTEEDLGIYYYNRIGHYWEKLDYTTFNYDNETISVKLKHFSEYQVMASKYTSPSLDSYYNMGVSPFQSYFQNNVENVSPTSGNLAVSATDLTLPGRTGNGLTIQRIYDSAAAQQEKMIEANNENNRKTPVDTFGYGWSLNIPWIEQTDKGKFIRLPQGQTIKFSEVEETNPWDEENEEPVTEGDFEYHEGIHFKLHFDFDNGYYLTMNDGSRYEFDKSGKATRYLDPSGKNIIKYEYNGREISRIIHLVDEQAGKALYTVQFNYQKIDGANKRLIESITVGDRTVRYKYNPSGVLAEVYDPMNSNTLKRKTVYSYEFRTFRQGVKADDDEIFSYSVDLLNQIIYPTGEKSTYTYDFRNQEHTETITVKSFFGLFKKKKEIRYEGTKSLVANRLTAGKEINYSYQMNGEIGSIKDGNFVPAHTYMRSTQVTEGDRILEYIFRQIEGKKLTVTPEDIENYNGPIAVEIVTKIDKGREIERIAFDYDVPKRATTLQQLFRGGELVSRIISQYDNWGNQKYRLDESTNLEETWSYYSHNLFKNLPLTYSQKSYNRVKNRYATVTTTYQYDSNLGKPLAVTVNDGSENKVTRFTYDSYGNVKTKVDQYNDNFKTEIFYDGLYQTYPVKQVIYGIRDADGNITDIVTETGYDYRTGLKQWEKDPRGFITGYEYDKLNRVLKVTLPDDDQDDTNNPFRRYIFYDDPDDPKFNTSEFINEKGQKTTYQFDGLGRLTEVVQDSPLYSGGVKTSYRYNNMGQIQQVTDPRGKVTAYEYDGLNRVTKVTYPGGAFAALSYDDATNTVTVTDENGGQVSERKDWAGRLVEANQYYVYGEDRKTYTWSFAYDSLGNKLHSVDPLLNRTEQEYDALGRLKQTTMPTVSVVLPGKTLPEPYRPVLTYDYDTPGNRTAEVSANGNATDNGNHQVEYRYDQLGRKIKTITKATDPVTGAVVTAEMKVFYDEVGNKVKTIDPKGGVQIYTYSARGWLLSETDPAGNTIRYQYDVLGNKIAVTDPRGNGTDGEFTTWYVYDDLNRLSRTVLPDNTPPANPYLNPEDNPYIETAYDEAGNKLWERDANGVAIRYGYTDRNWLWKVIDAKGRVQTEYTYDKKGNQIEVKDALGRTVKKSYDSLGRLRKVTDSLNNSEEYFYDAVGNKTAVTDARGNTAYFAYNSLGWQTGIRQPSGNFTQYRYDPNGNRVETIAPNGLSTKARYDELNRVIENSDSLGHAAKFSYDLTGNRSWSQDRRGTEWVYQYYANNLLQRVEATGVDGSGYWAEYTYDQAGNPKTVKDNGNEINYNLADGIYVSDPLNRINNIERRFDGVTYRIAYQYDPAGLVKGILYPEAKSMVEYKYNDLNQLTEVAGFTKVNGINYNIDGSLQGISYANGAMAVYNYDPQVLRMNRLKVAVAGQELLNLSYTYDEVSNIKTVTDNGKIKTYEYDKNNQLIKSITPGSFMETDPTPGTAALKTGDTLGNGIFEFTPILSGLMGLDYYASSIGIDFGGVAPGVKRIELVPDKNYATHRINENTIALYVSNDNMNYTLIPRISWEYQKSDKGIVTLTTKEKIATRYLKLHIKYDERGRNFEPVNKSTFLNEIAKMLRVYQEATSRAEEYQYDANGNRKLLRVTLVQTAEFTSQYYNNTDRLKTDGRYAFAYDNAGNVVKKGNTFKISEDMVDFTPRGEGVEYWEYKYDLLNRLINVTKNGTIVSEYAYDPEGLRVVKKAKGETTHYVFQGTEPIFEKRINAEKAKSNVYALGKYLARVDGVIGDAEAKKYFYHTDHVGSIRVITDQAGKVVYNADYLAFGNQFVKDGDFEELHGFTGKEYDPDIGLYYFNARWYDPDLGRFISEDPAGQGPNPYSYCGNNPVMRVDPTGKIWWWLVGAILGGLDSYLCGGDFMQGFIMGAMTGAIGAGVNTFVSSAWGSTLGAFGSQVVSGAIAGGITGEMFGEGFGKGAVFGAVAGAISYGVDMRFGEYASRGTYNRLVVAGLKGGLNGLTRGGDFVEGFAYGVAYGLVAQKTSASVPPSANHPGNNGGPTLAEEAEIAGHIYIAEKEGDATSAGYKLAKDPYREGSLKIGIYVKEVDGKPKYVIANKGSTTLKCWANNFLSLFGLSPDVMNSIEYVRKFVADHPDADITYVGHSKGGAEAAYNAIATNRDATLFNAAPVNPSAYGLDQAAAQYTGRMDAYIVKGEILNSIFFFYPKPTSNVDYLPSQSWNPVTNHGMPAVMSAIKEWERRKYQ